MSQRLFDEIAAWQKRTFPETRTEGAMNHLRHEFEELERAPDDVEEMADMVFMLIQLATLAGGDLWDALILKYAKNQARTWRPVNGDGVYLHASEGTAFQPKGGSA